MNITWHGNSCFRLKGTETSIALDPDKEAGKIKADIVMTNQKTDDQPEVEGLVKTFDWPGEYEIKNVPITAFQASRTEKEEGKEHSQSDDTNIFYFKIDKFKVCHLGAIGEIPDKETIQHIEDVDVLMIETGEGTNLPLKKALEIVESIDPRIIIPMGKTKIPEFIKEFSAGELEEQDKLVLKSRSDLPDDSRKYVLLKKV